MYPFQHEEPSLQVSHIETPPPKQPRTHTPSQYSENILEISYTQVPVYKPRVISQYSEKSLEVSYIETPSSRRSHMCSITSYPSYDPFDDKLYEQELEQNISLISRRSSTSSTISSHFSTALSSFSSENGYCALDGFNAQWEEKKPPPYAHIFYNYLNDKPLPPLPRGETSMRLSVQKPLPPLPQEVRRVSSLECRRGMVWSDLKQCWIV